MSVIKSEDMCIKEEVVDNNVESYEEIDIAKHEILEEEEEVKTADIKLETADTGKDAGGNGIENKSCIKRLHKSPDVIKLILKRGKLEIINSFNAVKRLETNSGCELRKDASKPFSFKTTKKMYKCTECNYYNSKLYILKRHIKLVHRKLKAFRCGECSYASTRAEYLTRHVNAVHKCLNAFKCEECDFVTANEGNLKRHVNGVHRPLKLFNCDECHYVGTRAEYLTRHVNSVHKSLHPFKCEECSYTTCNEGNIKRHVNAVHRNLKLFNCDECNYVASDAYHVRRHVNAVHKKWKRFMCEDCDFATSYEAHLRRHLHLVHKKLQTFNCKECDYTTTLPSGLKSHMKRAHKKVDMFNCENCDYNTTSKSDLKRHVNCVHKKIKRRSCEECASDDIKGSGLKKLVRLKKILLELLGLKQILGLSQNESCRFCKQGQQSANHLLSGCEVLMLENKYTVRHNNVCQIIHWKLMKHYSYKVKHLSWKHEPVPLIENGHVKITYDKFIPIKQNDDSVRPHIVVIDKNGKKAFIIDVRVTNDFGICQQERDTVVKYEHLKNEMRDNNGLDEVEVIPLIMSATGLITKNFSQYLSSIPGNIKPLELQFEVVRESVSILQRLQVVA